MVTRPEDLHPALSKAYNASDFDAVLTLYDPKAAFVIKPGCVTEGPTDLRTALKRVVDLQGRMTINPQSFVRFDDIVLVLGTFTLAGHRSDGTAFENTSRFADVLRRQPDRRWLIVVDNPFGGD
jgi:ketosteroid isomerase-like protein